MTETNPIVIGRSLETSIRKYLGSALPVSRNYPRLAAEIERLLNEPGLLLKGPFVEAVPDYPKAETLQELAAGTSPLLHSDFNLLPETEFRRPLHQHQSEALRAIMGEHLATGTGSGKTECFPYPILDSLLKESPKERQQPGVRALLVYPLNALANDQLYRRVVPMFVGAFEQSRIKVGRFTGITRDDPRRVTAVQDVLASDPSLRAMFGDQIPESWQLTRQEMLAHPPHALITNYAMLEHLLLFPKNAALFRHSALRFLVLDEVHTYTGTQASEVALLLRKLRRRLGLTPDEVRCIGTSASLAKGDAAEVGILRFASDLFGSSFTRVIRGDRQEHSSLTEQTSAAFSLPARVWADLGDAISAPDQSDGELTESWNATVRRQSLPPDVSRCISLGSGQAFEPALAQVFAASRELRIASRSLAGSGAMPFATLAIRVFGEGDPEAGRGLAGLVGVGLRTRFLPTEFSLLPARYHFFANGVDNVTVRLESGGRGICYGSPG